MRALSSLGQTSSTCGPILSASILSKLIIESKKHMAHEHYDLEWSIHDVMAKSINHDSS